MWGAVSVPNTVAMDPVSVANFFLGGNGGAKPPPIIAFHGKQDQVLPCNSAPVFFSPSGNDPYHKATV